MSSRIPNNRFANGNPGRSGTHAAGSLLVARQCLDEANESFLDELCRIDDADRLGGFAAEFYQDRRSHARQFLLDYIQIGLSQYRHEAIYKRLFKLAEANGDDEAMGRFLVALDRSIRRQVKTRNRWDWQANEVIEETYIVKHDQSMPRSDRERSQKSLDRRAVSSAQWRLFSTRTREYLRRRAWRYFRELAKSDPVRYRAAIAAAIALFEDTDTQDGLALLDNWSLVHVMFHHSEQLQDDARGWNLATAGALSQLKPAPYAVEVWQSDGDALLNLIGSAQSRPVRMWAVQILQAHHSALLAKLDIARIVDWIRSEDEEVAGLAADSLANHAGASEFTPEQWFDLFASANESVLSAVCETAQANTIWSDWATDDLLQLAMQRPDPVARLALSVLPERSIESAGQAERWLALGDTLCVTCRPDLARLGLQKTANSDYFDPIMVSTLIDCDDELVRGEGMRFLIDDDRTKSNIALWQRVLESPYDDVQLLVTAHLERQSLSYQETQEISPAALSPALLARLWATVLLNTRRGGRVKLRLIEHLGRLLEQHPDRCESLLPLLSVALRSVRATEFRAALSVVVGLVDRRPDLSEEISTQIPELIIPSVPSTC